MKSSTTLHSHLLPALLFGTGLLAVGRFAAEDTTAPSAPAATTMVEVKITNLTANQTISPPIVASHDASASMFTPGEPASVELATLAEDGDPAPLQSLLSGSNGVLDLAVAAAGIGPGDSVTLTIEMSGDYPLLSAAGMLIQTNDTFFGLDSLEAMRGEQHRVVFAPGFDAGSEFNSEDCMYIPGPPCGGTLHDPRMPEGFVHVNNGIHGIGGLPAATYDWRNPVARIELSRL